VEGWSPIWSPGGRLGEVDENLFFVPGEVCTYEGMVQGWSAFLRQLVYSRLVGRHLKLSFKLDFDELKINILNCNQRFYGFRT